MNVTAHYLNFILNLDLSQLVLSNRRDAIVKYRLPLSSSNYEFLDITQDYTKKVAGDPQWSIGKAFTRLKVDAENEQFVEAVENRRYLTNSRISNLPLIEDGQVVVDVFGNLQTDKFIDSRHVPLELLEIANSAEVKLLTLTRRLIGIMRWHQDIQIDNIPLVPLGLYWGTGKKNLTRVPRPQKFSTLANIYPKWEEVEKHEFELLLKNNDKSEPLAREILSEASQAYNNGNERAATILACVALEVGIKTFIVEIAPDTAWLIQEIQSPSIDKMLRKYIPSLLLEKRNLSFPVDRLKPTLNRIQKLFERRNDFVHKGKLKEAFPSIGINWMQDIKDLLYSLDALGGEEWAKFHISKDVLDAFGWEVDPKRFQEKQQVLVTVTGD